MAPSVASEERLIMTPDLDRQQEVLTVSTNRKDERYKAIPQIGKSPHHRSRLQALGRLNITTFVVGLVLCLGVVAYLAFLWLSSPACGISDPGETWKAIALSNNFGISITISSVIVRLAMALQLGVAFSVVGILVLENGVAPIQSLPFILAMRGSGKVSVVELAQLVAQTFRTNVLLNFITAVLVLTTAMSQFTSTLLLSDLGMSPFLNKTQHAPVAFGLKNTLQEVGNFEDYQDGTEDLDFWTSGATEYPVFAEYSKPLPAPQEEDSMQDTGVNLRAFPPFRTSAERASLYRWDGFTAVFDARVTCLTPKVEASSLEIDASEWEWVDGYTSKIDISGYADLDFPRHIRWAEVNPDQPPTKQSMRVRFKCPVSFPGLTFSSQPLAEWAITICELGSQTVVQFFMESPLSVGDSTWTPGTQCVVFNATGTRQQWLEGLGSTSRTKENMLVISNFTAEKSDGMAQAPWTRLSVAENSSLSISLSVCITPYMYGQNIPVNMTRSAPPVPEPILRRNDQTHAFGLSEIVSLHSGAAKGLSDFERGILTLHKRADWTADQIEARHFAEKAIDILWRGNMAAVRKDSSAGVGVMLCRFCQNFDSRTTFRAHPSYIMVFQQVLRQTGNLAYAVQALFTILLQKGWYDYVDEFDVEAEAAYIMYTYASNSLIPVRMVGMAVVVATILVHNIVVLVVVIMFLRPQRISVVGNLWQGFGQVVASDQITSLAESYTMALDKEVAKDLKDRGIRDEVVELVYETDKGALLVRRGPNRGLNRAQDAYREL